MDRYYETEYHLFLSLHQQDWPSGMTHPRDQVERLWQGEHTLGGRGSIQEILKQIEHVSDQVLWRRVPMSAGGVHKCDCESTRNNSLSIMVVGINAQILKESKCHSYLQEGREGGPTETQPSQPQIHPWEDDEVANPRKHSGYKKNKKSHQERSVWECHAWPT